MMSLEGAKSESLISKIQAHESPPKNLQNLFTASEIECLKSVAAEAYSIKQNTSEKLIAKGRKPLGQMAHPQGEQHQFLKQLFQHKLKGELSSSKYDMAFSFHRNYFPYGTHTDSGYDQNEWIYKQGIVPLEVDPPEQKVFTIIFEQKVYHSVSYPSQLETIDALRPEELKVIHNYNPALGLSSVELAKYFQGSNDHKRFQGFQIALPFQWKVGNMALWDRSHLHCSSDFNNHGVNGKLGLMWISWRV